MPSKKNTIKQELLDGIKGLCEENKEVTLVSLCTVDGFSIKSFASKRLSAEVDKLAALSSTVSALSGSAANMVLNDAFNVTIIETDSGSILFVSASYLNQPCVLIVAANHKMALATARYKTKKLAETISNIQE